jgi:hypothetical protein
LLQVSTASDSCPCLTEEWRNPWTIKKNNQLKSNDEIKIKENDEMLEDTTASDTDSYYCFYVAETKHKVDLRYP